MKGGSRSAVVLPAHFHIVLNMILDLSHLDLIVHHICRKIPKCSHLLHPLRQLVELPQRLLPEIVKVQLQRHQAVVRLQRLRQHLQPVIVDTVVGQVQVNQRPVLRKRLRNRLGSIVAQPVGRKVEGFEDAELGGKDVMDGLCSLEGDAIGGEIQDSKAVVLKAELFDGIDGIAGELVLAETELFQSSVDLQHLGEVDGALLADAFVLRSIEVQRPQ